MFDKHMSLDDWCAYFREKGYKIERKLDHEPSGRVTQAELRYCRQDVKITHQLLNAAIQEFNRHPLPNLLPEQSYSPAVIAKEYMREMGIVPPMKKFKEQLTNEINGIAMQAYYGGRSEVHVRRTPVPVMRLDFKSCYCTVNTLLRNFDVLTAESITFPDATDEVSQFLSTITLEACFDPNIWSQLRFFALVKPDYDIFPVRAPFNKFNKDRINIGLEYLTDEQPIWFAGPDIIASILLNNGKVPTILKAIRVVPSVKKQDGLRPVQLLGKVHIDPRVDDFYRHTVEQKEASKDEPVKKGLKCVGNGGAYGPLVQLNEDIVQFHHYSKRLKQKISLNPKLDVYSGEHYHQQKAPREIEVSGPFYFPPIAALITAGSRLLLACAEKCVEDAGGQTVFCDTDSLCIAANEKGGSVPVVCTDVIYADSADQREFNPIPCLKRETVLAISKRFESLNPYSFGGTILSVEKVNYQDDNPSNPFRELYAYAISAKRYCLGEGKHFRNIVDAKLHGIGWLMSPVKRDKDADRFGTEFWQKVLQKEGVSFKNTDPEWLDWSAMMKIPVSSPAVIGRLKEFCKPYDFVLSPVVRDVDIDEQADKPILVTRFTKNIKECLTAEYFNVRNVRTVKPCRITIGHTGSKNVVPVRTYRDVLNVYVNNAESKFNGADGKQCWPYTRGVLQRMHVVAKQHKYCGKEIKRKLEQGPVDHETDFKCKIYENGRVELDREMRRRLSEFTERQIQDATGLRRDSIRSARNEERVTQKVFGKLFNFLEEQEKPKGKTDAI